MFKPKEAYQLRDILIKVIKCGFINTLLDGRLLQELAGSIPLKAIMRWAFSCHRHGLIFQLTGVLFSKLLIG